MLTSGGAEGPPPPEFGVGVVRAITTGALFWIHKVQWDAEYSVWRYSGRWNPDARGVRAPTIWTYPAGGKYLPWEQLRAEVVAMLVLAGP